MKKISITFIAIFLTITFLGSAHAASDKSEKAAKTRTEIFQKVALLSADETKDVYQILLEKEKQSNQLRTKYKDDKKALKDKLKPVIKASNRKIKDLIGAKRMNKVNAYLKALRKNS